jgi:hypothetical protein
MPCTNRAGRSLDVPQQSAGCRRLLGRRINREGHGYKGTRRDWCEGTVAGGTAAPQRRTSGAPHTSPSNLSAVFAGALGCTWLQHAWVHGVRCLGEYGAIGAAEPWTSQPTNVLLVVTELESAGRIMTSRSLQSSTVLPNTSWRSFTLPSAQSTPTQAAPLTLLKFPTCWRAYSSIHGFVLMGFTT